MIDEKKPKPPYVHQDFPRVLYLDDQTAVVKDAAGEKAATAAGYSRTPQAPATEEPALKDKGKKTK